MKSSDHPGVVAPPPVLFATALALGLLVDYVLLRLPTGLAAVPRWGLALVLLLAAMAMVAAALGKFRRAGTHAEPWRPTTAIVTDGIYAFSRNPMYLAMTLLYCALALAADSLIALAFVLPLLVVLHFGVILREERYLEAKFGDAYRSYREKVRRWL